MTRYFEPKGLSMEIVLIRHGKPIAAINPKLSAIGFMNWVVNYNASKVDAESFPSEGLRQLIQTHFIVTSDLARAIDSVKICGGLEPHLVLDKLREMEIPSYKLPFKLKAYTWLVLNRILWFIGVKNEVESFKEAKIRANNSAKELISLALQHNKVVVFGHGLMNKYIAKELEQFGWDSASEGKSYWSTIKLKK